MSRNRTSSSLASVQASSITEVAISPPLPPPWQPWQPTWKYSVLRSAAMSAFPVNGFSLRGAAGGAGGVAAAADGGSGCTAPSDEASAFRFGAPDPPEAGTAGTPYSSRIARICACRRSIAASSRSFKSSLPLATPIEMSKDSWSSGTGSIGASDVAAG